MKKVLIIAYYFPPHATVGAFRPFGFCRYLAQYGWLPHVISTDTISVYPLCQSDEGLSRALPSHVQVDRVPYVSVAERFLRFREQWRKVVGRWAGEGLPSSTQDRDAPRVTHMSQISALSRLEKLMVTWAFDFPDPQKSWCHPVVSRWKEYCREGTPDLIFATGGPWTGLVVGRELAHRMGVPLVADFRDPWALEDMPQFSAQLLKDKSRHLEEKVCASASAVVANTDEMRSAFVQRYPHFAHKIVTITNGFDAGLLPPEMRREGSSNRKETGSIELTHFGNIYGSRNASSLLQALQKVDDESGNSRTVKVRFVGAWDIDDPIVESLAKQLEKNGIIRRDPALPHDMFLQQMSLSDILLVIQPHSSIRVPAKIYQYITSGRPVLFIGKQSAASHLLSKYHLGTCCLDSVAAIKEMLRSVAEGTVVLSPPAKDNIEQFEYRSLTRQLADVFNNVLSNSR